MNIGNTFICRCETHRVQILVLKDTAQQWQQLEKSTTNAVGQISYFFSSKMSVLKKKI